MKYKSVNVSELKAKLSQYLRVVKAGREVVVLDRNLPIARLVSVGGEGSLELKTASSSFKSIFNEIRGQKQVRTNSLAVLEDERKRR